MLLLTFLFLLPILTLAIPDCHTPIHGTLPSLRDCADVVSKFYTIFGPPTPSIVNVSGFRSLRGVIKTPVLYRNPDYPTSTCAVYIKTREPTDEDTFPVRYLGDAGARVIIGCFPSRTGMEWIPNRRVVSVALVNPNFRGLQGVGNGTETA